MSGGPARPSDAPAAPRVVTAVPWVVVLLGAGLIVGLLVVTLLSLRGEERPPVPAPAPPMYLPTLGVAPATAAPTAGVTTPAPAASATTAAPTGRVTRSPSATASPAAGASRSPTPRPRTSTRALAPGGVTARYETTERDRDGIEASLTVVNGSGGGQDWTVELLLTGKVRSIRASSSTGLSVSARGDGVFVLRGTAPLPAGQSATVRLWISGTGIDDRPGRCTVNGADCTIG